MESSSFEAVYEELHDLAYRIALRTFSGIAHQDGREDAQDISAEVMVAAWQHWPIEPSPRGWVVTATRNKTFDWARKWRRHNDHLEPLGDRDWPMVDEPYWWERESRLVWALLPYLTLSQRIVIEAELRGAACPPTWANQKLRSRGLKHLRMALQLESGNAPCPTE